MAFLLAAALVCSHLAGPDGFIKTTTDATGIYTLQTAAHRLTAVGKPDVWLVGVAHIGAKSYYKGIQALLDAQGEVLFEGVKQGANAKPKPTTPPPTKSASSSKPIYEVLGDALGLDFQLTDINYNHPNWIDSDLTMEQLDKLNSKESGGKSNQFNMIEQLMDPNSPMAQQFAGAIKMMTPGMIAGLKLGLIQKLSTVDPTAGLFDAATSDVILRARNQSVENYFAKAVSSPTPPKSVAIFYGALHQDSLEHFLVSKYGYTVAEHKWFKAASADTKAVDAQGKMILDLINNAGVAPQGAAKKS